MQLYLSPDKILHVPVHVMFFVVGGGEQAYFTLKELSLS